MSEFTPGKWYVGEFGAIFADQPPEHEEGNARRANVFLDKWTAENRANARLVASAPQMYELLTEYCAVIEDFVSIYDNFPEELTDIVARAQNLIDEINSPIGEDEDELE